VTDNPASLARVLGAELFPSEAPSELWARIAALERDRDADKEARRVAREKEPSSAWPCAIRLQPRTPSRVSAQARRC
jgi:hypothetical protein